MLQEPKVKTYYDIDRFLEAQRRRKKRRKQQREREDQARGAEAHHALGAVGQGRVGGDVAMLLPLHLIDRSIHDARG